MKLYQILTIIGLVAIIVGSICVLVKTGQQIWRSYKRSVAEEEKPIPVVVRIDFYDSKGNIKQLGHM